MSWAGRQHPLETAIEWFAPIPLALAIGWASSRIGLSHAAALVLGIAALAAGFGVVRRADGNRGVRHLGFEPAELAAIEPDELYLEEKDAVLELDDRLEEPKPDSRVVRLFERPEPTPGELVDRIVDFLAEGGRPAPADRPAADSGPRPDASAALHDALANIRASLR